jgi:hypothetical protein
MSILVDQDRKGIVSAIHLSSDDIDEFTRDYHSLRDSLGDDDDDDEEDVALETLALERLTHLAQSWMQTVLGLDNFYSGSNPLEVVRDICTMLSIGLVSFSGSHVCRFDINLWEEEVEEISTEFHSFIFQPRKLACLDDFIGGPAWILRGRYWEEEQEPQGAKLSLTVQDVQELWGPVSLLGGTADEAPVIRTERGFIVPLPRGQQTKSSTPLC